MAVPSDANGAELHRIVLRVKSCGGEQKPQNLGIGLSGPTRQDIEQQKHQQSSKQAVEEIECGGAEAQGEEKEFPLGPEDG
jgi:hypothetical protein